VQRIQSGRQTYVLYDPEQPEHCDIDHERLTEEFGSAPNGKHRVDLPLKGTEEEAQYRRVARAARVDKLAAKRAKLGLDPVARHSNAARPSEIRIGDTSLEDLVALMAQAGANAPAPGPEERLVALSSRNVANVVTRPLASASGAGPR
jgi:hypothetical protein